MFHYYLCDACLKNSCLFFPVQTKIVETDFLVLFLISALVPAAKGKSENLPLVTYLISVQSHIICCLF